MTHQDGLLDGDGMDAAQPDLGSALSAMQSRARIAPDLLGQQLLYSQSLAQAEHSAASLAQSVGLLSSNQVSGGLSMSDQTETGQVSIFGKLKAIIGQAFHWLFGGSAAETARRLGLILLIGALVGRGYYDYRWTQDRLLASEAVFNYLRSPFDPSDPKSPNRAQVLDMLTAQAATQLKGK